WMQNDGWTEGSGSPQAPGATGITLATLSSFLGSSDEALGTFSFNGATSGSSTYSLNLPASFSADILSGGTLSVRMFAADNAVSPPPASPTFRPPPPRPLPSPPAVPEPSPLSLGFLGLAVFAHRRLRSGSS